MSELVCLSYVRPLSVLQRMLVFLRFNELAFLCCCDVRFCDEKYVELFIAKSKTDIYRNGNVVVLAKIGHITCPFSLLSRYVQVGNINLTELN